GYINARVSPEIIEKDDRIADLVVHVDEGDQFRVGRIEFEGNTRTRDKVLRRELRIHEGLVLSLQRIQNSLLKIKQLGYFNVDEADPVQIVNVDDEEKTIDVIIKGVEADRTELQFGGGWSEFDGFFGQMSVRTQNFLGRGETLGVSFQSGRTRDFFDLSYFIPWFLDRPQSFGVQAFSRETNFGALLQDRRLRRSEAGGSVTYGRSFGLFNSVSLSYLRTKIKDEQTIFVTNTETGEIETRELDLSFTQSALRPVYQYNSIDSPFEPTRGSKIRLSVDYAGGFLGATQSFYRPDLTLTRYQPVTKGRIKTVLGLNARAGLIEPFDDYQLSLLDRFFLGGDSTVRGFSFRDISVLNDDGTRRKDSTGFFNVGGDKYLQFNLEYHFLTNGPFRFLLFGDAGGVFDEDQSFDFGKLRYSAGIEVRVLLPLFGAPLRFIYATNLDPLPDDNFDSFDFTIGASF
ncbi:MAG: BamA/TamA family outer membrane protein, partial [Acidobacteria bacterium]|nr:BamA/TamA family outer membrane protein [Acidobacteriota bacterium]